MGEHRKLPSVTSNIVSNRSTATSDNSVKYYGDVDADM